jgi:hypothetical protein
MIKRLLRRFAPRNDKAKKQERTKLIWIQILYLQEV